MTANGRPVMHGWWNSRPIARSKFTQLVGEQGRPGVRITLTDEQTSTSLTTSRCSAVTQSEAMVCWAAARVTRPWRPQADGGSSTQGLGSPPRSAAQLDPRTQGVGLAGRREAVETIRAGHLPVGERFGFPVRVTRRLSHRIQGHRWY
ncbi:hypothetical protein GCM10018980_77130 [Streptomyces capoamus]|uniref:Uncharacterized protein n=1 Tax=Streptomyces capoamus TaxID=68183 RepID=A0A919F3Y2_9ACTN|nr:hypothetical protein [Streptomyces capoamus]GHG78436.1 hypothetical protein GCM10018980_77130 [Streptomyces capoamus]